MRFWSRLRALFRRSFDEREIDDELRLHIELLAERFESRGMNPAEAAAAARRQFGGEMRLKEELRERRSFLMFDTIWGDCRYALRQMRKSPVFSLTAVLTLALGIGANSAIFSMVRAVLAQQLPFESADRLCLVWETERQRGWGKNIVSAANFNDWRKVNHVFTDMAATFPYMTVNLTGSRDPVELPAARVTPNLFRLLGVRPALGRDFLPEEGRQGGERVVVLNHFLWQRLFGSDPSIIGRAITLSGRPHTVVGVMPPSFNVDYSSAIGASAQVWIAGLDLTDPRRTFHNYIAVARLRPGVTREKAQAELNTIAAALEKSYPDNRGWGVVVLDIRDELVGDSKSALLVLMASVGMVLLLVCVNLTNLLLARGASRGREFAVRRALGAVGPRLALQALTESSILSVLGAGAGLVIARAGINALTKIGPVDAPGLRDASLNGPVLWYTAGIAVLTTLVFGLAPYFAGRTSDASSALKAGGRTITDGAGTGRMRRGLVAAEFALALVLAVSAGLMIRTLMAMKDVRLGFAPDHVLSMRVALSDVKYTEEQQVAFYNRLLTRVQTVAGVRAATVSRGLPLYNWQGQGFAIAENPDPAPADAQNVNSVAVAPQYFDVLRIPLIRGRVFNEHDDASALPVAIVNEALAKSQWPGQDPIGKRLRMLQDGAQWRTVVGVVANVRTLGPTADYGQETYLPYTQPPSLQRPRHLLIRTDGEPTALARTVRQIVREMDGEQPVSNIRPLASLTEGLLKQPSFLTYVLGGFAAVALLLAAVGVYGVMTYSVNQRTREMGIRIMLGASTLQVVGIVLRQGMLLALWGIVFGVLGGLAATRVLTSQLYGVKPSDPLVFTGVALILATVAAMAAYLPARRAAKVDPAVVLRWE